MNIKFGGRGAKIACESNSSLLLLFHASSFLSSLSHITFPPLNSFLYFLSDVNNFFLLLFLSSSLLSFQRTPRVRRHLFVDFDGEKNDKVNCLVITSVKIECVKKTGGKSSINRGKNTKNKKQLVCIYFMYPFLKYCCKIYEKYFLFLKLFRSSIIYIVMLGCCENKKVYKVQISELINN